MAEAVVEADIHRTGWVARSIGGQNENWILLSQSGGRISAYRAATYLLGGNWARIGLGVPAMQERRGPPNPQRPRPLTFS